jgi:hypothetical protein
MNQKEHKDRLEEIFWEKFNKNSPNSEEWGIPSSKLDNKILKQTKSEKNKILLSLLFFFISVLVIGVSAIYFVNTYIQQNNNLQVEGLFNVNLEPPGQDEINSTDIIFCDSSIYELNITNDTNLQASLLKDEVDLRKSLSNVEQFHHKEQFSSIITYQGETYRLNNTTEEIILNDAGIITDKVENSIVEQNNHNVNTLFIDDKLQGNWNAAKLLSFMPLNKDYPLLSTNIYALATSPVAIPERLKQHKWSFEMVGGKFINLKPNTFNVTTEDIDFTINKSVQANNFGLNIERKINNRLLLGWGVHYLTSSFTTDYGMKIAYDIANEQETPEGYTNAIQQVIPSLYYGIHGTMLLFRPKHTTLLGNTHIPMSLSLYQKMSSWNVPIYAKVILPSHGKWTTYGKVGITANFVQNKLLITDYAAILPLNQTLQLEHRELHFMINPSKSSITSRVEINYLISAGVRYGITNNSYTFVEPLLQGAFNTVYAISDIEVKDQMFAGVFIGVGTFF